MIPAHGQGRSGASLFGRAAMRALAALLCLIAVAAWGFSGTVRLADDERVGGHTIERHVGRSEADLRRRLQSDPRLFRASSFATLADAETAVNEALRRNAERIASWLREDPRDGRPRAFYLSTDRTLGHGMDRRNWQLRPYSDARVVLRRTNRLDRGFYVLTAYPEP